ncbi:MAG TPA: EAL domain-containing protein [Acidimicrobiales bacterium]|nr:EAL domain-containing protein [Acidimicrobiales bacterium]
MALVVSAVAVLLFLLVETAGRINDMSKDFSESQYVMSSVASVHRESLRLEIAATERGEQRREELQLRRGLLGSQMRVLSVRVQPGTLGATRFAAVQEQLQLVDTYLVDVSATDANPSTQELTDALRELERRAKALYDAEDHDYFATSIDALEAKSLTQTLLVVLGVLATALGAMLVFVLKRAARNDLRTAYSSLQTEMVERQAAESALRMSEERFRSLVQHSSDMVAILDEALVIQYWSPARQQHLGYDADEPTSGLSYLDFVHEEDRARLRAAFSGNAPGRVVEYRMRHRDGSWRTVESLMTDLVSSPAVSGIVLNTRDVTERRQFEDQLAHQAFHDPLTSLANRALFADRLTHAVRKLGRTGAGIAVIMIDLDRFKYINDSLGHGAGDRLLADAARRLRHAVRESDTIARFGGDEFAIVMEDTDLAEAELTAQRVVELLRMPFDLDGSDVWISASVGVAATSQPVLSPEALLRDADVAMYAAKRSGKATFRVYEPAMGAGLIERLELETELRDAAAHGEFELHYQPTVDLMTGATVGVEALLRWNHPVRGLIPPSAFIPIAEECGLIVGIGQWVLEQACAEVGDLTQATDQPLTLAVNVSPRQLADGTFVESVIRTLRRAPIDPRQLVLEITETTLMDEAVNHGMVLEKLRELGVRVAVDDFGTGYSSLGYLHQLPIDLIKIDRSFVEGLSAGAEESVVASTIIQLGHSLGLEIIAEGIEQLEQAEELRQMECHLGQGFYYAQPMSLIELRAHLTAAAQAPHVGP